MYPLYGALNWRADSKISTRPIYPPPGLWDMKVPTRENYVYSELYKWENNCRYESFISTFTANNASFSVSIGRGNTEMNSDHRPSDHFEPQSIHTWILRRRSRTYGIQWGHLRHNELSWFVIDEIEYFHNGKLKTIKVRGEERNNFGVFHTALFWTANNSTFPIIPLQTCGSQPKPILKFIRFKDLNQWR